MMFQGSSILITGGTGSFGQAFARLLLDKSMGLRRIIIFSRDELKQVEMQRALEPSDNNNRLRYFIGDVRDADRLKMAMVDVDFVVHAAALKQIPVAEYNPFECINTNINGSESVIRAAIEQSVNRVILISSDKAVHPVNLYGATKLAAEKLFVAANALSRAGFTRFSVVRYGNVVASRGSVIPLFREKIEAGETLPITDEAMTRFWIRLDDGARFVLDSMKSMQGGEIFVPKLPSVSVLNLAVAMAGERYPRKVVGIRPGEKLHEILISTDESRSTFITEQRYIIEPTFARWERVPTPSDVPRVEPGFEYTSNGNDRWLTIPEIQEMLE